MTDPTASGPNPSGCRDCGEVACRRWLYITKGPSVVPFIEAMSTAKQECAARPRVDWQAECARLTAQLAAATARAGEAAPQAVTGVVRKKMGNGARYIELDDHPHLTTAPRLPSKCGNGYIVEVRPLRAGGGR